MSTWQYQNFLIFNQSRNQFITIGEDGQLYIYQILKHGKAQILSFTSLHTKGINDVPTCADWAMNEAGGFIAVGGSKRSLTILHPNSSNFKLITLKQFTLTDSPASLAWSPKRKHLLCGTLKGNLVFINGSENFWREEENLNIGQEMVVPAWISEDQNVKIVGCGSNLYRISLKSLGDKRSDKSMLHKFPKHTIKQILPRKSPFSTTEILILLTTKVSIAKISASTFEITQEIDLLSPMLNFSWGWSQNEIACYPQHKAQGNEREVFGAAISPTVYKRSIYGIWESSV